MENTCSKVIDLDVVHQTQTWMVYQHWFREETRYYSTFLSHCLPAYRQTGTIFECGYDLNIKRMSYTAERHNLNSHFWSKYHKLLNHESYRFCFIVGRTGGQLSRRKSVQPLGTNVFERHPRVLWARTGKRNLAGGAGGGCCVSAKGKQLQQIIVLLYLNVHI